MINQYFNDIEEKSVPDEGEIKNTEKEIAPGQKLPKSKSQQITITGLAFHLGFSRRQAFEDDQAKGRFADHLKGARLRVIADYEKKLHGTLSTVAIFALKKHGLE